MNTTDLLAVVLSILFVWPLLVAAVIKILRLMTEREF